MRKQGAVRTVTIRGEKKWVADLRMLGRGRKYFATKADAIECAEREGALHTIGAVSFDPLDAAAAMAALRGLNVTLLQAAREYAARHSTIGGKTLLAVWGEFEAAKIAANKKPRYVKALGYTIRPLIENLGSDRPIASVRREEIEEWLNGNGWSPASRRGLRIDFNTFFAFAQGRRYIAENPCEGIPAPVIDDKPPGIFTVDQCRALMETARELEPSLVPYFALALFAGIRPEEVRKMVWPEVRLAESFAEVTAAKSKTRRRRIVTLEPCAVAWLKLGGQLPPVNFRRKWQRVRNAAGLQEWPHDVLRHSYASYHLAQFGSADKTAVQMGHASTQMLYAHYRELVRPADAAAFWGILPAEKK